MCNPRYHGIHVRVVAGAAGYSDLSQLIGQDVPFLPDPSQRVLVLIFDSRGSVYYDMLGVCAVHSETILRLPEENGEGAIEWEVWREYTIAPNKGDFASANELPKYLVSGGRFVKVYPMKPRSW